MMLDMVQYCSQSVARERGGEVFRNLFASAPGPYSLKHQAKSGAGGREIGKLAHPLCRAVLVDRDVVDIAKAQVAFAQAICHRLRRKPGPMLHATKALFFRRRNKLAVLHNAGRTVRVERIEAENDHLQPTLAAVRARSSPPG